MNASEQNQNLAEVVKAADWYHTIDLGNGIITEGDYDHRPFLKHYKLPADLKNKRVLDIGTASGFFSFEFERRGAQVTCTDLPDWKAHDFGPNYQSSQPLERRQTYLHEPFEIAKRALGSKVERKFKTIYEITPESMGMFDLVFCGSVLVHLSDPIRALWNIASVTKEKAIIAAVISPYESERPIATMIGHERGDGWWRPTRTCLELMVASAGFMGLEWISEFQLDYRDGTPGAYHGVLHAYKTTENWNSHTTHKDEIINRQTKGSPQSARISDVEQLRALVAGYERGRFIRFTRWVHDHLKI